MARRTTRAAQKNPDDAPSQTGKVVSFSVPPESNKKIPAKRSLLQRSKSSNDPSSAIPVSPPSLSEELMPSNFAKHTARYHSVESLPTSPSTLVPRSTSPPASTRYVPATESSIAQSRRRDLQTLQATRYPHLAGTSEPNLNEPTEVRHFEVDSQGSLTFLLLDGGEAWRLREVEMDSAEKGQMIVGRFYIVERV